MTAVAVIGLGKVGLPLACYLNLVGHKVSGYDSDQNLYAKLRAGENPLPWEPGVQAPDYGGGDWDLATALKGAAAAFIVVPTPEKNGVIDSGNVCLAIEQILDISPGIPIAVVSTLDPRDANKVCEQTNIIYNPPLIRLGHVIEDLTKPSMLLLGSGNGERTDAMDCIESVWRKPQYRRLRATQAETVRGDARTIATAKLAINATLSQRIAWANSIASLCEHLDVNTDTVLQAVTMDPRLGFGYMRPGWKPAGPCLPRDLDVWNDLGNNGISRAVRQEHEYASSKILNSITKQLLPSFGNNPPNYKVVILGMAYNPGALSTVGSLGRALYYNLPGVARPGVPAWQVRISDPAFDYLCDEMGSPAGSADAQAEIDRADIIIVTTPWPEYEKLDFRGKQVIHAHSPPEVSNDSRKAAPNPHTAFH